MKINDVKYLLIQAAELENCMENLQGSTHIDHVRHVAREAKYLLERIRKEEEDVSKTSRLGRKRP